MSCIICGLTVKRTQISLTGQQKWSFFFLSDEEREWYAVSSGPSQMIAEERKMRKKKQGERGTDQYSVWPGPVLRQWNSWLRIKFSPSASSLQAFENYEINISGPTPLRPETDRIYRSAESFLRSGCGGRRRSLTSDLTDPRTTKQCSDHSHLWIIDQFLPD